MINVCYLSKQVKDKRGTERQRRRRDTRKCRKHIQRRTRCYQERRGEDRLNSSKLKDGSTDQILSQRVSHAIVIKGKRMAEKLTGFRLLLN